MTNQINLDLYNEIREKLAIAVETQLLLFLDDDQLDFSVRSVYNDVERLRDKSPGCDLNFYTSIENGTLFIAVYSTIFDISCLIEEERIIKSTLAIYNFMVNQLARKSNLNTPIKTKTYMQDNKIITEFL